jgi:predicted transcriptional regulator of viral defense system
MTTKNIPDSSLGGLGRTGSHLLTTLASRGRHLFTTQDAHDVLGGSLSATRKLLHDLVQRGWLHPLGPARYLIIPLAAGPDREYTTHEYLIAMHLCEGGYIAYWTALHHHGLTEQIPTAVFVATTRRCRNTDITGVRYVFVALRQHKFFGQQTIWIEEQPVAISDVEKTLVDSLDHPEHSGGIVEVAKGLHTALAEERIDLHRLTEYARRANNRAIFKRLGFLTEELDLPAGELPSVWQQELSTGYARLDPSRDAGGNYNRRWRVQANVGEHELTGWMEY